MKYIVSLMSPPVLEFDMKKISERYNEKINLRYLENTENISCIFNVKIFKIEYQYTINANFFNRVTIRHIWSTYIRHCSCGHSHCTNFTIFDALFFKKKLILRCSKKLPRKYSGSFLVIYWAIFFAKIWIQQSWFFILWFCTLVFFRPC